MSEPLPALSALLYREAALLDAGDYAGWLALYSEDARYWVPSAPGQNDPLQQASIIYEDRAVLALRIARLVHPRAHALRPPPRTLHLVSNILPGEYRETAEGASAETDSALLMVEYREPEQRLYAARVHHRLRRDAGAGAGKDTDGWLIVEKRVELLDCDGPQTVMSVPF